MPIQYFAILGLCIASLIFETGENHCEWFSLHDKGSSLSSKSAWSELLWRSRGTKEKLHQCIYKENKSLFSWPTLKLRRQFDSRKTVIREDPTGSPFICFVYF